MSATSAISAVWDYQVTKGAAWSESLSWSDADGVPIDITDATVDVVIKSAEDSSGASVDTISGTIVSGPAGTFTVGQTMAEVDAMTADVYWWAATLTLDGADPVHLWHGRLEVADVVKP